MPGTCGGQSALCGRLAMRDDASGAGGGLCLPGQERARCRSAEGCQPRWHSRESNTGDHRWSCTGWAGSTDFREGTAPAGGGVSSWQGGGKGSQRKKRRCLFPLRTHSPPALLEGCFEWRQTHRCSEPVSGRLSNRGPTHLQVLVPRGRGLIGHFPSARISATPFWKALTDESTKLRSLSTLVLGPGPRLMSGIE